MRIYYRTIFRVPFLRANKGTGNLCSGMMSGLFRCINNNTVINRRKGTMYLQTRRESLPFGTLPDHLPIPGTGLLLLEIMFHL